MDYSNGNQLRGLCELAVLVLLMVAGIFEVIILLKILSWFPSSRIKLPDRTRGFVERIPSPLTKPPEVEEEKEAAAPEDDRLPPGSRRIVQHTP